MAGPDEARIVALACSQQRNVTRQQLLALGLGPSAIAHRARSGRLHRVFTGVYAVGTPAASPTERASAAVLACGDGAALSRLSALFLWGLHRHWSEPIHVTTFRNRRRPGIVVHVSRVLTPADLRTQRGIRITSPSRTVLDCAVELGDRLPRVIDDARIAGLLRIEQLTELIRRCPRHPGASAVAAHLGLEAGPTRSDFELAFLDFCTRFGLPLPQINAMVEGFEADAWFPAERVVVELDGWRFHQGKPSFEGDRERDAVRLTAGIVTYRLTWRRLIDNPEREARRLRAVLASRG